MAKWNKQITRFSWNEISMRFLGRWLQMDFLIGTAILNF